MARKCDNAYSCGSIWGVLNKAAIGDERKSRGIRHSMSEILLVILLGFLAGCTSLRSIAGYFAPDNPSLKLERQKLISSIVDLPFGIPDSSTLSRSIKKLNPVPFVVAFAEYMTSLVPHDPNKQINLAIDGKAVVAALNKRTSGYNYYIVNVFAAAYHLFMYHIPVGPKSAESSVIEQEIAAILSGNPSVITMDAMGTKKAILDIIFGCDSDAVLPVKANNKNLMESSLELLVQQISEDPESASHFVDLDSYSETDLPKARIDNTSCEVHDEDNRSAMTTDEDPARPITGMVFFQDVYFCPELNSSVDFNTSRENHLYHVKIGNRYFPMVFTHGRYERREYDLITDPTIMDRFKSDPSFKPWPQIHSIGLVTRYRGEYMRDKETKERYLKITITRTPYILTREMNVEEFASCVRGHWACEQSHNTLDEVFKEDRCQARAGTSAENLSLLRKLVFNLVVLFRASIGRPVNSLLGFTEDMRELAGNINEVKRFIVNRIISPFKTSSSTNQ